MVFLPGSVPAGFLYFGKEFFIQIRKSEQKRRPSQCGKECICCMRLSVCADHQLDTGRAHHEKADLESIVVSFADIRFAIGLNGTKMSVRICLPIRGLLFP